MRRSPCLVPAIYLPDLSLTIASTVSVGTPPQLQTVILDTGSSDLYFDSSSAETCQTSGPESCQGGTFDKTKSDTYNEFEASPAFNTSFGDGSTAVGPYGQDMIGIGDVVVSPVQFGLAEEVDTSTGYSIGLLGLGYSTNEAVSGTTDFYENLPEVLARSGEINSRLYSIYLNDADANTGTILFGGIDKTKYKGDLATLNLIPAAFGDGQSTAIVNQFITTVTGASATVNGRTKELWSGGRDGVSAYSSNNALPVLLDTGSTAWSIPSSIFNNLILPQFPYVDRQGLCPCSHAFSSDSLTLEFGGKVSIDIPARQFIVPVINSTTRESVPYSRSEDACAFLLVPTDPSSDGSLYEPIGDAILRSMYVVFDLDNGQVSIAQANVNSTDAPDIVTVAAGPTGVAEAVSGVSTAPSNTWSIAPEVPGATSAFSVVTAATPLGTATGVGAVPASAQVEGEEEGGSSTSSGGKGGKSKGAAAGRVSMGSMELNVLCGLAIWLVAFGCGVGLIV
ncbi:aspartyl protease [Zymoseptoria tritici IPO323]|uniref:Aspartyl protease n=1 Tax=Zymoseptoria tritici (strain CBS 115943 / IPO323) TaxID=336722 RepID=F9X782_ZYMTI|nr:aspartyl protease [Zymoseptoria tritici IPO323]EGP88765.1 aspartyl protease [Zymoseptoria tritici IPO323]